MVERFIPTGGGEILSFGEVKITMMRFIPTGVGNTSVSSKSSSHSSVHPHGRGEYDPEFAKAWDEAGSSPRAWGIHMQIQELTNERRFIPTGVGNTFFSSCFIFISPVHPHGRGEYLTSEA